MEENRIKIYRALVERPKVFGLYPEIHGVFLAIALSTWNVVPTAPWFLGCIALGGLLMVMGSGLQETYLMRWMDPLKEKVFRTHPRVSQ